MVPTIVQINFKVQGTITEYREATSSISHAIADVPGLHWKIWLLNESNQEAGGIYLFADPSSAQHYLSGPIITNLRESIPIRDFNAKQFGVEATITAITRGPISERSASR